MTVKYKRILLKLSGEVLGGQSGRGYDANTLKRITKEIKAIYDQGVEIAIVIGGGNIFRGNLSSELGIDQCFADYMGMLATIMNSLALQDMFEQHNISTRVLSSLEVKNVVEPFVLRRALKLLKAKKVLILAGGLGSPLLTTDTPAALRAIELKADCLIKATKVDGIYSKDPTKFNDAIKYDTITFEEALEKKLNVMDMTAFTLCMEHKIPVIIFNIRNEGNLLKIINGETIGSKVIPKSYC